MTDKKLLLIVKEFRHGILGRKESDYKCFMVCAPLQGYLKAFHGLETELVEGYYKVETKPGFVLRPHHVWLKLSDGRIIDPTRDQFGYPEKVYIGVRPKNYFAVGEPKPRGQ